MKRPVITLSRLNKFWRNNPIFLLRIFAFLTLIIGTLFAPIIILIDYNSTPKEFFTGMYCNGGISKYIWAKYEKGIR